MITGLQLALLSGGLTGLGLTLLAGRLLPVEPDLADALERVSSTRARTTATAAAAQTSKERLGLWVCACFLPVSGFVRRVASSPCCGSRSHSSTARS